MIGRGGEFGGHLLDQRVLHPRVAPLVGGDVDAFLGRLLGVLLLAEEIKEIDCLLGRGLGDEEGVDAAKRIGRLALAARHDREGEDADVFLRLTLAARRIRRLHADQPFAHELHRGLAIAEDTGRLGVFGGEVARLEWLQRRKLAQPLAGLDKGRALEPAVFACLGVGQCVLAADPHHEIGIVEVHRPFLAGPDRDRRDAGGLERLHRGQKVIPALDVLGLHARLLEQLLVVEEGDDALIERHADRLAVDFDRVDRGRRHVGLDARDVGAHVLEEAGLGLRFHDAAAPAVDEVWPRLVCLQHGRQLGLERFVLEIFDLNLHARMRRLVIPSDLVPKRLRILVLANVEEGDSGIGKGRGAAGGGADGREREMTKVHGFPPRIRSRLFYPRYKINLSRPHEAVKHHPASTLAGTVFRLGQLAEGALTARQSR